ncbi:MAG: outer membrane protein [Candidatus Latescibacterota bacterium]|jgi:outer membrane protein
MTTRILTLCLLICAEALSAHAQSPLVLTLSESLLRAQKNNETLLIAQQDLETARQRVRESLADGLPQLDANFAYNRNWLLPSFVFGDQSVTIGAHNNLTGSLGIRQTLYSGGKLFASMRVARQFRSYSLENIRLIQQRVHHDIETAFYDLLLAHDLLSVNKLSLSRAQANYLRVQRLYQAGRVSEYDLLRAQTQVSEIRPDSIRASNHLKLATLTFKNQMSLAPETPIEITGTFRSASRILSKQEHERIALGLQFRPEMRQQNALISMRQNAETVTRSDARPKLELVINGQWEAQRESFKFSTDDFRQSWFSGLNLSVPLFDGFRTRSQVAQAQADTRRAKLGLLQTERGIQLEISQAHHLLAESMARKTAQEQTIGLAQKGLRIAETRYDNGIGTQLEVIDGQLTVQRAEAELAQAKRDVAIAIVRLEHRMGILGEDTVTHP